MTQLESEPQEDANLPIAPTVEGYSAFPGAGSSDRPIHPETATSSTSVTTAPVTTMLRLLIVEDSEDDALLIIRELRRGGYTLTHERVDNRVDMATALSQQPWDLVIADFSLPNFNAFEALRLLQNQQLDLPFIIVSGSIGEDTAVAAMKAGAHDYLMKDNLARLIPAVARELRESQERAKRRAAEEALRHSENRFRSLIENALDIIAVLDDQGTIRYLSPSSEQVLGYKPEELTGQSVFAYIQSEDVNGIHTAFQRAIHSPGQTVSPVEFQVYHQDGSCRVLEAVGKQVSEAMGQHSLIVSARDITERKQVEETRKALQKEKELNELKSRFVSMVSHEFRTPLSVIVLAANLLERFHKTAPEEKRLLYLDRIQAASRRMTQLLDDVLFLGKTELGKQKFKPAPLDLVKFCHDVVEEIQLTGNSGHTIHFTCATPSIPGCMDESLLRHILSNLLANAVKYSPTHKTVDFALTHTEAAIQFQIYDQGIGIPEADLQRLFESFHRGSNVGKIPGTGLGLAIVYQSVQLHHGEIAVASQVNVGTRFTVTLPRYSTPITSPDED